MAVQSNLKNMVVCLTLTCLACSAILGGIYAMTKEPIDQTNAKILSDSIKAVLPDGGELSEVKAAGDLEYYEYTSGDAVSAYAVKSTTSGFGGPLTLMVGVLPDGTVYNTSVLSHTETPGLGAKCTSDPAFMEQWKNFGPDKILAVKKDHGDVDAITASTITSRAYTEAVKQAVDFVKSIAKEAGNE
ncbi:MAG: RnfABCDGE type electron transport complex subunit G [Bacteroidales bacterium]|jgi:electron transport complex protein RnfG|nr:RnfABCDGE type electron transport complex subunit G [Bacteroidales bacterium]MBQ4306883.1 RnfABCDGE type electron transport complex subunit G [Bacteroidales bacterium]MBQ5943234.1 RnfABCDGE type electron transport complex subunit G [Bacteroidales bacterium]